ncbi:hypothetical protein DXG03_004505 [Asterophora parasitica]|uniref:CS domain-containing protein n=1 Tax=Asterophora parasitica TaxID=117018 RepID=A0A9P7G8M6_9AGAR|nr:hypothetical protein DXG03_004505 [Asterophora parasitica]
MTQHPEVLWAQRSSETVDEKNIVYLTVNLPDIQEQTLSYDLTATSISFKARTGECVIPDFDFGHEYHLTKIPSPSASKNITEKEYEFNLEFFADVVPDLSTKKLTTRSFSVTLRKKENKEEYWPRLTKAKGKNAFLKTDFSKWVDEDEQDGVVIPEEEEPEDPTGGLGGLGGMGGMPPGMDFQKMLAQMGGGAGGAGLPDFGAGTAGGDDDDSDDDGPPPLEDAEPSK